jgi:spore germination cell wall hydrolase CwlJ-like protein
MVASRNGPKGRRLGPFGLGILVFSLLPTSIGSQDILSLLARQPAVEQRARAHMLASPFGTIHVATFSFPRPIGSLIPETPNIVLASLDVGAAGVTGSIPRAMAEPPPRSVGEVQYPSVNRALKGDRLVPRVEPQPALETAPTRDLTPGRVKTVSFPRPVAEPPPPPPDEAPEREREHPLADLPDNEDAAMRLASLYFGAPPAGTELGAIQPWPAGQDLIVQGPAPGPDLKLAALAPAATPQTATPGHSLVPKGQATGPEQPPRTPAERLRLDLKSRVKSEKCLADAVYFESRGEPKRGQIAVAQVVMNRVFSGFYPNNVCGVVYQNANRRNACQFTFACDGIPDVVNEPDMWKQAKEIARDMLDGKLWLPEIGYSTHYHAYWVHPSWVNEMRKLHKIGVHSFYRPRAWGDTIEVPNYTFVPPPAKS